MLRQLRGYAPDGPFFPIESGRAPAIVTSAATKSLVDCTYCTSFRDTPDSYYPLLARAFFRASVATEASPMHRAGRSVFPQVQTAAVSAFYLHVGLDFDACARSRT